METDSASLRRSRTNEHLANERTLLSWVRLSIAVSALGFVVARFGIFIAQFLAIQTTPLHKSFETGLSVPIGVLLVLAGPLLAVLALIRFIATEHEIDSGILRPHHTLIYALIGMAVLIGALLAVYLLLSASTVTP
ncbi:MAG: DUF202 domain-containing protein [Chloroflexi bacterium]|nr:DUF202 domain-containing protein [Chloroflexota bacterium]